MENIKIKIEICCECNCELRPNEQYVCDSCRRMILEYERKHQDDN